MLCKRCVYGLLSALSTWAVFLAGRSYHPGFFSGRLNRVNDVDTSGLEYFWSCCGQPDKEHPGCITGRHASYDNPEEGGVRSPLTGSKLR